MAGRLFSKRVAGYWRYSCALQREASLEDQRRRCTEFVKSHGGEIAPHLEFGDAATSGTSLDRAGFERMMAAVRRGEVDVIVVEDLSRISRDIGDADRVFKELQYLGVPLMGVADGMDTSRPDAKVGFALRSVMGELYIQQLSDKTSRGLVGRFLAGYATGGLPLGYKSEPARGPSG